MMQLLLKTRRQYKQGWGASQLPTPSLGEAIVSVPAKSPCRPRIVSVSIAGKQLPLAALEAGRIPQVPA